MSEITVTNIGTIYTPHKDPKGTPIQPPAAQGIKGEIVVEDQYVEGLADLHGFSHIIVLYFFHRISESRLMVRPFLDAEERGVFSTRAPARPNRIGLSIIRLDKIEGNTLFVSDVDMLDETPLLDIKPYVEAFDLRTDTKSGWLSERHKDMESSRDDGRFL